MSREIHPEWSPTRISHFINKAGPPIDDDNSTSTQVTHSRRPWGYPPEFTNLDKPRHQNSWDKSTLTESWGKPATSHFLRVPQSTAGERHHKDLHNRLPTTYWFPTIGKQEVPIAVKANDLVKQWKKKWVAMPKKKIGYTDFNHFKLEKTYSEVVQAFPTSPTLPTDSITKLVKLNPSPIWAFNHRNDPVEIGELPNTFIVN